MYFSSGRLIVASDTYTGAQHGEVGYGDQFVPKSYSIAWGARQTASIVTAGNYMVVAAGINYYPFAAAGFSGGVPANGGNSGSSSVDNKKTVIIIVVVVVVVILIVITAVSLKSRRQEVADDDYVPMNMAQV